MNNQIPVEGMSGLGLGDVYYIIFRHKWKIVLCALAGIAAAGGIHFFRPPPYESQAELLVKYIPAATQLNLAGDNQKVIVPDQSGDEIINSEIQILTSMDLAEEAATDLGAPAILGEDGPRATPIAAAVYIRNHLEATQAQQGSSVIVVTFKHPNPLIVQPVLQNIINDYFRKHYEIHSAMGQFDNALTMEQSTLSLQLNATEQQIADLKNRANIISLDDSQKDLAAQISKISDDILDAQAELSGDQAAMKQSGATPPPPLQTTNAPAAIPQDQLDAYAGACANLDALRKEQQGYSAQGFTKNNDLIQEVDEQIANAEKLKTDLEKKYPQIAAAAPISQPLGVSATEQTLDPKVKIAEMASLQAKIKAWNAQLADLRHRATNLNNLAPTIDQLEQTKAIEEANYQNLSVSLEKSRIDEALDPGKSPDIKWVQMPSPPMRDWKKTDKAIALVAVGGIIAGIAWAFLIEMLLDRSVKRPLEIEARLKLPLFLSIPDFHRNGHRRLAKSNGRLPLPLNHSQEAGAPVQNGEHAPGENRLRVVSLEQNPALQPFYEALRDRLIVYFEIKNLTHKPKLVAVTGARPGAGVSTVAAGLAASLSETGDGNVLLVDMNLENGAAQQFCKGKACCGLESALKDETRHNALVGENLYVVNGNSNGNGFPHALPKRFSALVPRLKASDYDYIIFDMPVVSPTSVTSRLGRFMDMTLLVVESEKTDRDVILQANQWLVEAGSTVSVVLNKTRKYVPARLQQEFLSDVAALKR